MSFIAMLRDALKSLFHRPVTRNYPTTRTNPPPRLRGTLHWNPDACTGCSLCVRDCPANAIELTTVDRANKVFEMRYDASRCIFCAQCVQNCRFGCLTFSPEGWELAGPDKEAFTARYGQLENVNE